ncbi:MAG TPA: hypothetical protein VLE95_04875 [Chlamydiales bacterium]|nr:hypothetical protein [Chlamydiales bacterium]
MSWFSAVSSGFASGAVGAALNSTNSGQNITRSQTTKKADETASKIIKPCGLPDQQTRDHVLRETLNGNYGNAWEKWCEGTRSNTDPITGESRNEPTNGSDVNSTDKS